MTRRRRRAGRNQLLEKGLLACVLGCAILFAPLIFGSSPLLRPVAQALKIPGWLSIVIGVALLIVHKLTSQAIARPASRSTGASGHVMPGSTDMFPPGISPAPGAREEAIQASHASSSFNAQVAPRAKRNSWDKQVFDQIEWRRFEAVCERLFAQAGFQAKSQSHGVDGGVDIWLYSKNSEGPAAVVQCKHWSGKAVGVKEIREFFGVMASRSLKRGTFATSSTFTSAAVDFAKENRINILDGEALLALIRRRTEQQQQELLEVAYEGEYWRPTCASCGVKMVDRPSAKEKSRFWGCANFPRCRTTLPMRAAAR